MRESCTYGSKRGALSNERSYRDSAPMRRREFITLLGGTAVAWPLAVRAQQLNRVRWVGVLMINPGDQVGRERSAAFEQSLEKLGWAIGRNFAIDYQWGVSDLEKARAAVAQILRRAPDVILANG